MYVKAKQVSKDQLMHVKMQSCVTSNGSDKENPRAARVHRFELSSRSLKYDNTLDLSIITEVKPLTAAQ